MMDRRTCSRVSDGLGFDFAGPAPSPLLSLKDAALSDPTQVQQLGFAMLELLGESSNPCRRTDPADDFRYAPDSKR